MRNDVSIHDNGMLRLGPLVVYPVELTQRAVRVSVGRRENM
jgi:hypothetical protein